MIDLHVYLHIITLNLSFIFNYYVIMIASQ